MNIMHTDLIDCFIIKQEEFLDERGVFFETFQQSKFESQVSQPINFVQDNFSRSKKNVLRGMHFQKTKPQGKLVRVSFGSVYDVAIDLRKNSKTFKKWIGIELNDSNNLQMYIPPGFAHGFLTLSDIAHFEYKCTEYYSPNDEKSLRWDDPEINILWPNSNDLIISEKDMQAPFFKDLSF